MSAKRAVVGRQMEYDKLLVIYRNSRAAAALESQKSTPSATSSPVPSGSAATGKSKSTKATNSTNLLIT